MEPRSLFCNTSELAVPLQHRQARKVLQRFLWVLSLFSGCTWHVDTSCCLSERSFSEAFGTPGWKAGRPFARCLIMSRVQEAAASPHTHTHKGFSLFLHR